MKRATYGACLAITDGDINRSISPNDEMFIGDRTHYFDVGRSALECINHSLQAAHKSATDVKRILDLPCGHGRVLRYLNAAFPQAEITACDLLSDGVDFCAATFGAIPVYSNEDPTKIPLERNAFDLIWVGSLLTHVDSDRWIDFLDLFRNCLCPGGVLVFSTHGRTAYRRMIEGGFDYGLPYWRKTAVLYRYKRAGFGYANYPYSKHCGHTLSAPDWVFTQLARLNDLRLAHFSESAWDNHHDIFACIRDPGWQAHRTPVSTFTFIKREIREALRPK